MSGWRSLKRPSRGTSQREAIDGSTVTFELADIAHGGGLARGFGQLVEQGREPRDDSARPASVRSTPRPVRMKSCGAQPFLEVADMPADGGMGHEKLGRGVGEAFQPGGGFEGLERIE